MTSKEQIAIACKLEVAHLDRLIAMKRFAGKSASDIERELEQMARLNSNKQIVITTKRGA
jgi:hypothetical protein